jgi:hypothetical protein
MRGLKTQRTASVVIRDHALVQNPSSDHYDLAVDAASVFQSATVFNGLSPAI